MSILAGGGYVSSAATEAIATGSRFEEAFGPPQATKNPAGAERGSPGYASSSQLERGCRVQKTRRDERLGWTYTAQAEQYRTNVVTAFRPIKTGEGWR